MKNKFSHWTIGYVPQRVVEKSVEIVLKTGVYSYFQETFIFNSAQNEVSLSLNCAKRCKNLFPVLRTHSTEIFIRVRDS